MLLAKERERIRKEKEKERKGERGKDTDKVMMRAVTVRTLRPPGLAADAVAAGDVERDVVAEKEEEKAKAKVRAKVKAKEPPGIIR